MEKIEIDKTEYIHLLSLQDYVNYWYPHYTICSKCGTYTPDEYVCSKCGNQDS